MKWGHGEEECVLTLGGLIGTRCTRRNRACECSLNYQKSAEAVVPDIHPGRAESFKENCHFAYATFVEAETWKPS